MGGNKRKLSWDPSESAKLEGEVGVNRKGRFAIERCIRHRFCLEGQGAQHLTQEKEMEFARQCMGRYFPWVQLLSLPFTKSDAEGWMEGESSPATLELERGKGQAWDPGHKGM